MPRISRFLAAMALLLWASVAHAQDARALAATCAACHGDGGSSPTGRPLRALPRDTLRRALLDFRSGARSGTLMPQLARGYTDAEIDALAGWFAPARRMR